MNQALTQALQNQHPSAIGGKLGTSCEAFVTNCYKHLTPGFGYKREKRCGWKLTKISRWNPNRFSPPPRSKARPPTEVLPLIVSRTESVRGALARHWERSRQGAGVGAQISFYHRQRRRGSGTRLHLSRWKRRS